MPKELLSSSECLECGHLVTDHHRAGGGWHNGEPSEKRRDHCVGNRDRCPCRRFVQPHTLTRKSVVMG